MKTSIIKIISSLSIIVILFGSIYANATSLIVGGDKDVHGCIGSAGYVWSTSSAACIRPWEQGTITEKDDKNDDKRMGCFIFTSDLKYGDGRNGGSKSSDVMDLQDKLRQKGYLSVASTGYFGPATLKAVKKYQRDNGISQTGYIGEKTRGQLRNHFCAGVVGGSTTTPIAICDYAAPVVGCKYVPGPNYNSSTQCGMILDCSSSTTTNYNPEQDKNCKVWNDGCNTCSRTSPTGPAMCTKMACLSSNFVSNKPYCKEYFQGATTTTALIKDCPTSKITNMMPVMCIQAPCNPVPNSYYIYNGTRHETSEFDSSYVSMYCKVPETVAY